MNPRGLTRGDGLVFVCVGLIFGFSFAPYMKASASGGGPGGGSSFDEDDFDYDSSSSSSGDDFTVNAWAQDHWPLMAVVVLLPIIAFVLLVAHRYMVNSDQRPVGGLTLRQWATAFSVVAAWAALWSLGGNVFGNADFGFEMQGIDLEHGFGAFVILPFTVLMALLMMVIDRSPALAYPLFVAAPAYPHGYIPQQPGRPGYAGQPGMAPYGATGGFAAPVVPPGTPVSQMPPPMTHAGGIPVVAPAAAAAATPAAAPAAAPPGAAPAAEAAPSPAEAPAGPPADAQTDAQADAQADPQAEPEFAQFWLAVPEPRPLAPVGGLDKTPVATLVPGTWYLAVDAAGDGFVVEVDGVRGVLQDASGIQRGE
ncbi:hypothetical protein [Yinghuangia sp. YIM S10712]|uniref:hypothetical protein n=1 Tax=Yinghuangia sp. YIM S10712 TaxID=3436930 RepID=UPI003F53DB5E